MITVNCIIVTYNAMKWIEKCISSIKEEHINLQIIVIDNNSTDNTVEFIKTRFPFVQIFPQKENLGFGGGNNLGYAVAKQNAASYVYLLNQDTISYPNTISKLIKISEQLSNVGVVSPIHLNEDGSLLDSDFEKYINAKSCPNYISDTTLGNLKEYYPLSFINAAAWLIKTDTVEYLGGLFSTAFFHYGEDVNFIGRLRKFGFTNVIVPGVFMHHCKDERIDGISKQFQNKVIDINKVNIMHDIKIPYAKCYKNISKYALQQLMNGKIVNFIKLMSYPLLKFQEISSYRKSYINRRLEQ